MIYYEASRVEGLVTCCLTLASQVHRAVTIVGGLSEAKQLRSQTQNPQNRF